MSEITWGYLSMRQQETLQDIVLGKGAVVFDPAMQKLCEQLQGYGLVEILIDEETKRFVADPTDNGCEVFAQKPVPTPPAPAPQPDAGEVASTVMSDFDELLNNLSGTLNSTVLSILRTYFAAEHGMRLGTEAQLAETRARLAAAEGALQEIAANANRVNPATDVMNFDGKAYIQGVETGWYNAGLVAKKALQASGAGEV